MTPPRFGTDGWRAQIADGFTFDNLRRVVQSVADLYRSRGARRAAIAYDHRFLARRSALEAASVLLGNGLEVRLSDRAETTPALSCQVVDSDADFGLMLTASHNPPEFLGLKIKTAAGASAPPEVTQAVEVGLDSTPVRASTLAAEELPPHSFRGAHEDRMSRVVDLERLRSAKLRIAVDSMYGTGGRIAEELLRGEEIQVDTIRGHRDPLFGGQAPEPTKDRMQPLLERMGAGGYALGFATDGDGDRIAAVDDRGTFVSPLRLIAVLALHLIRQRRVPGGLAKTFANTIYLDRIAAAESRPFHCFPVGFKHIAALLERDELAIGGEESGGIGVSGYLPERDGILAGLLLTEAVVVSGQPLSGLVDDLVQEFGDYHYGRRDLRLTLVDVRGRLEQLTRSPPARVADLPVKDVDPLDGLKLHFGEEGWLLLRASGTEPVVRVYTEARSPRLVRALLDAGVELVTAGN